MAPRAYWKGYLKLSLVSCPISLFPATSGREKISFHQLNRNTGNRIRYRKVDAETGEEVEAADIVKGYEVDKGQYIELEPEELEAIALESKRTIEIDKFVPKDEIDDLYLADPYYVVPDGEVGQQAFAVIRDAIRQEGMVAIAKVVFTSREHMIALEPRGKGMMGVTLRYPYEVRKPDEYFSRDRKRKGPQGHARSGDPHRRHQARQIRAREIRGRIRGCAEGTAAQETEGRKDRGAQGARALQRHQSDGCAAQERQGEGGQSARPAKAAKKGRKRNDGQREMLLPISGKKAKKPAPNGHRPQARAERAYLSRPLFVSARRGRLCSYRS